jgi:hypothetical protein
VEATRLRYDGAPVTGRRRQRFHELHHIEVVLLGRQRKAAVTARTRGTEGTYIGMRPEAIGWGWSGVGAWARCEAPR